MNTHIHFRKNSSRCYTQIWTDSRPVLGHFKASRGGKQVFYGYNWPKNPRCIMYLGFIVNGTPKKQPRRCRRFTAYFGQNWDNMVAAGRFPVLKLPNFFSQIFIISYMRLKLRSLGLLHPQNMPKPIHHCSYFIKIIFLKKGPSDNLSTNKYLMSRPHVGLLHWNLS